jgi:tRNA 2-thiouridine synthesizing protein E
MTTTTVDDLAARLDALSAQVAFLVEQQKKKDELWDELSPIGREMMRAATTRLGDLEKKGYFAFGRELVGLGERIVEGYSPDDVRKLGDAVVGILDTVRAMTQPEVLALADQASAVLKNAGDAEPVGILGVVRASQSEDVQKGMSVMLEVLRHVGRGAEIIAEQRRKTSASSADRRARLQAITGARSTQAKARPLGIERPATPAEMPKPAACAVPAPKAAVAAVLDGVAFSADGHMVDAKQWTRDLAVKLARAQGVELGEAHWKLVDFARSDFEKTGASPNVRRITQGTGATTKDLYSLFPKAPARTIAKIAGVPKPAGCI